MLLLVRTLPCLIALARTSISLTPSSICLASTSLTRSAMSQDEPTPQWLQEHLTQLLSSPYIHFTQPKIAGLQLRMGPGPIDLFSTKFANMVTGDVTGVIAGKEVDKDGLKEALLKLQKKWNKEGVKVAESQPVEGHTVRFDTLRSVVTLIVWQTATKLLWTPKNTESELEIAASAECVFFLPLLCLFLTFDNRVRHEGGLNRISQLRLDADPSLFE